MWHHREVADEARLQELAALVSQQAAGLEAWESGELHLLELALRRRLEQLGVEPDAELGAALMTVAQLLAEREPEWGGDARSALCDVAVLGLRLLGDAPVSD